MYAQALKRVCMRRRLRDPGTRAKPQIADSATNPFMSIYMIDDLGDDLI